MTLAIKRQRVSGQIVNLNGNGKAPAFDELGAHQAENAIIGAVLREPSVFISTSAILQPADFHSVRNAYLWYAFEQIINRNEEIDMVTVSEEMEKRGQWRDEDTYTLSKLASEAPSASNAEAYARQIREAATMLRTMSALDNMRGIMLDRTQPIDRRIDECNRMLFDATEQQTTCERNDIAALIGDYFDRVEAGRNSDTRPGIPTGFKEIDKLLGGCARGEMWVWAGNDGMGKTSCLLTVARAMAILGLRVAIFSLEMTYDEIMRVFVSMESGIPKLTLKDMSLNDAQWKAFVRATGIIAAWNIHIYSVEDFPTLTPIQARRTLRKLQHETGVDVAIFDGLWLMEDDNGEEDRPRAVHNITRDMLQMTRDLGIASHMTHQYNGEAWKRAKDNRRPQRTDLAESAGVRRNSQIILGMYRDAYYQIETPVDTTEIYVMKDRSGSGAEGKHVKFRYVETRSLLEELGL